MGKKSPCLSPLKGESYHFKFQPIIENLVASESLPEILVFALSIQEVPWDRKTTKGRVIASSLTPPKFNMEPEHDGFQEELTFPGTSFREVRFLRQLLM